MKNQKSDGWSRREFLEGLALTGTAAMLGWRPEPGEAAVEPPPETTRLRIRKGDPAYWAPMYVAEPLLRKEGFTDIQYVFGHGTQVAKLCREGAIGLTPDFSAASMFNLEQQQHPLQSVTDKPVSFFRLNDRLTIFSISQAEADEPSADFTIACRNNRQ